MPENTKHVAIRWPVRLLARLDTTARAEGLTRTAAIIVAVSEWLARRETPDVGEEQT